MRLAPESAGTRTDIAAAIRAGVAALPPSAARRLVLLSDGQENLDHADPAAALASAAHVQLMTVAVDEQRNPVAVPPLEPSNEDERRRFECARVRRQLRQEYEQRFATIRSGGSIVTV